MANTYITSELLDSLLAGRDPKTVFEQDGLLDELKKALAERILSTELDHHLGQDEEQAVGNHRNGRSQKTVLTDGALSCRADFEGGRQVFGTHDAVASHTEARGMEH